MPYVAKEDRLSLDSSVMELAESICKQLIDSKGSAEISQLYRNIFMEIADTVILLETRKSATSDTPAKHLAQEIVKVADKYGYKADFDGELNYSITRLIQVVPKRMVDKGVWKEAFRYWLYAQTVGALIRTPLEIHDKYRDNDSWIIDGLIGVFNDIKDEYKRRVNTAYEAVQIEKNGDCYDTPYHTELVTTKDGYQEIMKDYRKK
jgi:predicted chitinase